MKRILRKWKRRKIFNMEKGTVKWFNRKKGFGFISNDETGIETFVHYSDINMEGFKLLDMNDKVTYEIKELEDGRTQAINVTVTEKAKHKKQVDKVKNEKVENGEVA